VYERESWMSFGLIYEYTTLHTIFPATPARHLAPGAALSASANINTASGYFSRGLMLLMLIR
jgi:hypothetical protein